MLNLVQKNEKNIIYVEKRQNSVNPLVRELENKYSSPEHYQLYIHQKNQPTFNSKNNCSIDKELTTSNTASTSCHNFKATPQAQTAKQLIEKQHINYKTVKKSETSKRKSSAYYSDVEKEIKFNKELSKLKEVYRKKRHKLIQTQNR